ncbi:hypothetical protein J2P12_05560, partial [Candidatus Bathyarchaeota archaeon]|nr:hypothetical protein [Candidatus Bathyarchaeota archaeon]
SFMTFRNGEPKEFFLRPIALALSLGMLPLIHGDLVLDEKLGFGVVSADRIASLLGEELNVSKVLFGCDVDGVFPSDLKQSKGSTVIREVTEANHASVLKALKISTDDATGGMRGKVNEALRLAKFGVESHIFNLTKPENLGRLLRGDSAIGTRFVPWK